MQNKVLSCTTLKHSCRVVGAPFVRLVLALLLTPSACSRLSLCVNACVHKAVCMQIWLGVKILEMGNLQGEQFSFFFLSFLFLFFYFFERNPCGVQFVSSLQRRVEEEKRRRQVTEGFWGHGNKKAAGSCTFHS